MASRSAISSHHCLMIQRRSYVSGTPWRCSAQPLCVRAGCAPDRIPPGRWVTDTYRPLAFSQQFAVNQILRTLSDTSGLFAVNGPPGTGKTTMLRPGSPPSS